MSSARAKGKELCPEENRKKENEAEKGKEKEFALASVQIFFGQRDKSSVRLGLCGSNDGHSNSNGGSSAKASLDLLEIQDIM